VTNGTVDKYVTNKWLIATLVALIMTMGGYIYQGVGRSGEVAARQFDSLDNKMRNLEIDMASEKVMLRLQYGEIIRRLDKLEALAERGK
jgi:predicted HTH transcriptional regulator